MKQYTHPELKLMPVEQFDILTLSPAGDGSGLEGDWELPNLP